jgi:phasin family protein
MSSTDQNKPAAKGGRRSRKAAGNPKPKQAQRPQADQPEAAEEPIVSTAAPAETAPTEAVAEPADIAPIEAAATDESAAIEAPATEESAPIEAAAPADAPVDTDAPEDTPPVDTRASADTGPVGARPAPAAAPVSLQTIANAYGDYTRRSLEETRSFVEKLKGAKSLDKAVEVQTEFAHHAFEMFVAESRKIYGLHKELARQTLKPLEGLMNKPNRDQR